LTSGVASELGAEDEHLDVVGGVSLVLGGEPIAGGRHVEGRDIPARPRRQRDHGVGNAVNQCRDCDGNRRGGRCHRGLIAGPNGSTAARSSDSVRRVAVAAVTSAEEELVQEHRGGT
jgi:hypothetical protein